METYVDRKEFELLKEEVKEIKTEMNNNAMLLHTIDKKLDVICQKMESNEQSVNYKIEPIEKRVDKIEDSNKWVWRTVAGSIIALAVKIIFDINR